MEKFDEYSEHGDYHRKLSPNWSYYPTYLRKTQLVNRLFEDIPKSSRILDIGCGEGVFVENARKKGRNIIGIDKNYLSENVLRSDIISLPFKRNQFHVVLFLDVIEHLQFEDQGNALEEIYRVLKPNGMLIITIPNLAHLYSRVRFLLRGKLARTASIKKHPGDRPISEFLELLRKKKFFINRRIGIFPTFPFLYKWMQRNPKETLWLYNFLTRVFPYPNFSFLNLIVCRTKEEIQ